MVPPRSLYLSQTLSTGTQTPPTPKKGRNIIINNISYYLINVNGCFSDIVFSAEYDLLLLLHLLLGLVVSQVRIQER